MRVLVQRVTSARVTVDGHTVGEITPNPQGLVALVGLTHTDDAAVVRKMADKLWRLRILDGELSAADAGAPILVVSQFTLYADTAKGRRPSWNAAAPGPVAEPLVDEYAEQQRIMESRRQMGFANRDEGTPVTEREQRRRMAEDV